MAVDQERFYVLYEKAPGTDVPRAECSVSLQMQKIEYYFTNCFLPLMITRPLAALMRWPAML